jgi:uncharacterized membrane protein YqaE (UPF0057 family)
MNKLLRYGLGIAIPPVGVFLTYGISPALLINLPLTLLGWLPGSIHAVWAIAKHYENSQSSLQSSQDPIDANV